MRAYSAVTCIKQYEAAGTAELAAAHNVACRAELLTCMLCLIMQSLRSKAEAGDKAAALELAEDDELFKQHMQPEELQRENRAKIRRVDPTVNLAADGFDRWSEGVTARDTSKVCTQPVVYLLECMVQAVHWCLAHQHTLNQEAICMCMSAWYCCCVVCTLCLG